MSGRVVSATSTFKDQRVLSDGVRPSFEARPYISGEPRDFEVHLSLIMG